MCCLWEGLEELHGLLCPEIELGPKWRAVCETDVTLGWLWHVVGSTSRQSANKSHWTVAWSSIQRTVQVLKPRCSYCLAIIPVQQITAASTAHDTELIELACFECNSKCWFLPPRVKGDPRNQAVLIHEDGWAPHSPSTFHCSTDNHVWVCEQAESCQLHKCKSLLFHISWPSSSCPTQVWRLPATTLWGTGGAIY